MLRQSSGDQRSQVQSHRHAENQTQICAVTAPCPSSCCSLGPAPGMGTDSPTRAMVRGAPLPIHAVRYRGTTALTSAILKSTELGNLYCSNQCLFYSYKIKKAKQNKNKLNSISWVTSRNSL